MAYNLVQCMVSCGKQMQSKQTRAIIGSFKLQNASKEAALRHTMQLDCQRVTSLISNSDAKKESPRLMHKAWTKPSVSACGNRSWTIIGFVLFIHYLLSYPPSMSTTVYRGGWRHAALDWYSMGTHQDICSLTCRGLLRPRVNTGYCKLCQIGTCWAAQ